MQVVLSSICFVSGTNLSSQKFYYYWGWVYIAVFVFNMCGFNFGWLTIKDTVFKTMLKIYDIKLLATKNLHNIQFLSLHVTPLGLNLIWEACLEIFTNGLSLQCCLHHEYGPGKHSNIKIPTIDIAEMSCDLDWSYEVQIVFLWQEWHYNGWRWWCMVKQVA